MCYLGIVMHETLIANNYDENRSEILNQNNFIDNKICTCILRDKYNCHRTKIHICCNKHLLKAHSSHLDKYIYTHHELTFFFKFVLDLPY